jgi:Rrf2 family protein
MINKILLVLIKLQYFFIKPSVIFYKLIYRENCNDSMQLTRQTEYAIRALIELASNPPGTILQNRSVAEKLELPEHFLTKTVQLLVRAGLVETRRGAGGGIKLTSPPESVTIADIINAVEGEIAINPCLKEGFLCKDRPYCAVRGILQRAQDAMKNELNKESLADLAKETAGRMAAK